MKVYNKPTIEFIELKPEERLACASNGNSNYGSFWWPWCGVSFPWGHWCKSKHNTCWCG